MANEKEIKAVAEAPVAEEVVATESPVLEQNVASSYEEKLKALLADKDNRVYRNIRIRNITKREKTGDWENITLVLDGMIPGYILQEDNTWKKGMTNNLYTTSYAIAGILKENEDVSSIANKVAEHPEMIPLVLNGAIISVVQTDVAKDEPYTFPFSTRERKEKYTRDHDWIANNIFNVSLGKSGKNFMKEAIGYMVTKIFGD